MKRKRFTLKNTVLTVIFVGILLFSHSRVTQAQGTTLQVEPALTKVEKDTAFTVNITANNIIDLYGWEFRLFFERTMINLTTSEYGSFVSSTGTTFEVNKTDTTFNATHGHVWLAQSLLGAPSGANGSGILASITFTSTKLGDSLLSFDVSKFSDKTATAITHDTFGGNISCVETKIHEITTPVGTFNVTTGSNTAISTIQFSHAANMINFTISGSTNTTAYCNVTLPKELVWISEGDSWSVKLNGTAVTPIISDNTTHTFIYFTASFTSSYIAEIIGADSVIPEFPATITTILMFLMLTVIIVATSKFAKTQRKNRSKTTTHPMKF